MDKQNRQQVVCDYISDNYVQFNRLRHDLISNKVQIRQADDRWTDITTTDINDIVCDCSAESGLSVSAKEVLAVLQSHRIPDVHPLREYVLNCPPHPQDAPDWIGWMANQLKVQGGEAEQQLWVNCFRKWFVAMVASWLKDEVVNQQVLVLIGRQGIFKTTWLEHLLPPELRAYSCKMAGSGPLNKDERLRIAEYGLIALDEIDSLTVKELNVMKSVITASDVSERAAYGYTKERRIRLASFCASGNEEQLLSVYFDIPAEGHGQFMTTAEISDKLITLGSIKRPLPLNRLGMLLKQAGYQSKQLTLGKRTRGWLVRELTADEVNANRCIAAK